MHELRILLIGRSPVLADAIRPALSRLLPNLRFHWIPEYRDAVTEMEQGGAAASLICVQGPQDAARVAEVLQAVQARHLSVPVFVIAPEPDVSQRFRLFELGPTGLLPVPVSPVRRIVDTATAAALN
jgi:DNA-binding NarL/FixJ family response regulator